MADSIEVKGLSRDNAILLLAAAEELELDPSVVRTTEGGFLAPAEVVKKAGLDNDSDEPKPRRRAAKKAAPGKNDKE